MSLPKLIVRGAGSWRLRYLPWTKVNASFSQSDGDCRADTGFRTVLFGRAPRA